MFKVADIIKSGSIPQFHYSHVGADRLPHHLARPSQLMGKYANSNSLPINYNITRNNNNSGFLHCSGWWAPEMQNCTCCGVVAVPSRPCRDIKSLPVRLWLCSSAAAAAAVRLGLSRSALSEDNKRTNTRPPSTKLGTTRESHSVR